MVKRTKRVVASRPIEPAMEEAFVLSKGMTLADCPELPPIHVLRAALKPAQEEILQDIWNRYRADRTWPKRADVVRGRGETQSTLDLLDSIGGSFVFEVEHAGSSPPEFHLTLLGVLLLHEETDLLRPLSGYLDLLKRTFIEEGLMESMTWREIQSSLGLGDAELRDLHAATQAFNFFWRSLGRTIDEGVKLSYDIDTLQDSSSGGDYLLERAKKDYQPSRYCSADRRASSGQIPHYIDEGQLFYYQEIEETVVSIVKQVDARFLLSARRKAAAACLLALGLFAVAFVLSLSTGILGLVLSIAGLFGFSILGSWKMLFPRLVRYFNGRASRKLPALELVRQLLSNAPFNQGTSRD